MVSIAHYLGFNFQLVLDNSMNNFQIIPHLPVRVAIKFDYLHGGLSKRSNCAMPAGQYMLDYHVLRKSHPLGGCVSFGDPAN